MPTYRVTDPNTGITLKLTGDAPPTAADIDQVFAQYKSQSQPVVEQLQEAQTQASRASFEHQPLYSGPTAGERLGRAAGITARGGLTGLAALPLAVADVAAYPVNLTSRLMGGENVLPSYQQMFQKGMGEIGLQSLKVTLRNCSLRRLLVLAALVAGLVLVVSSPNLQSLLYRELVTFLGLLLPVKWLLAALVVQVPNWLDKKD